MKKSKQVIWHKKQGKLVSPKFLKVHGKEVSSADQPTGNKLKDFAKKLTLQIKKAANE
jgi:hypothetical protein